jgi:translation initiation factor 4E
MSTSQRSKKKSKNGKAKEAEEPAEHKKMEGQEPTPTDKQPIAEKPSDKAAEKAADNKVETKIEEKQEKAPPKEHKLETPWTFYTDKKTPPAQQATQKTYEKQRNLVKLGTFNTLEGFWRHYAFLSQPSELPKDHNIYLMRNQFVPAWETFPNGGSWCIKVRKHNGIINRLWEETLFASIGELFAEPDVVGVSIATRAKEDVVQVWNKDNSTSEEARFSIGEKLKRLLSLHEASFFEYKSFKDALTDGSGHRAAKSYQIGKSTPALEPLKA